MLIHDLTMKYGPVVREGKVTGVMENAFDVIVVSRFIRDMCSGLQLTFQPEFGIEKRVHADKMPLENAVYDEHKDVLS
jgi:protein SSD1